VKLLRYAINDPGRSFRLCCIILTLFAGIALVLLAAKGIHPPKLRFAVSITTAAGSSLLTLSTIGVTKVIKTSRNKKKASKTSRNAKIRNTSVSKRPSKTSRNANVLNTSVSKGVGKTSRNANTSKTARKRSL
jgi:hypothetical protein